MITFTNKNLIASYISFGLVGFLGIAINILLLSYSGPEILGRFNYAFSILILASQFCVGGTQLSLLNHSMKFINRKSELSFMVGSSILLCVLFSIIFGFAIFLLNNINEINFYLSKTKLSSSLFLIAIFLFSVNKLLLSFINALNLIISYAFFNALRYIFLLLVIIGLAYSNLLDFHIQDCFLISEVFLLFSLLFFTILKVCSIGVPKKRWLKRHLFFGMKGFVGGFMMEMNSKVDILILSNLMGFYAAGIYSFAAMITEGFLQVYVVIKNNIDPIFSALLKEKKTNQISLEVIRIRRILIPIFFIFGIVLICSYKFIFDFFFRLDPGLILKSFQSFFILMIGILIASYYRPFVGLLIQIGKPEVYSIIILSSVILNILLNLILIPFFGIEGAAISTSIAFVIESYLLFKLGSAYKNFM